MFRANNEFEAAIAASFKFNPQKYHHVAIYYQNNIIIEATANSGVQTRKLAIDEEYDVYRCRKKIDFKQVTNKILAQVNAEYNHDFQIETPGFYCSELIQYGYNSVEKNIIPYIEMEFHDTEEFSWQEYYQKKAIPFSKKGTHPASIIQKNFKLIE